MQLKEVWEGGFELHAKLVPQHLQVTLTAIATVHTGKGTE
jgi:hypothetical protein